MDYGQIIDTLRGKKAANIVKVTIPEGYTMRQIAELMEEKLVCSASEFINTAKCRTVFGSDHSCTDTPGVDGRTLVFQGLDQELVQVVGSGDHCIFKTGSI